MKNLAFFILAILAFGNTRSQNMRVLNMASSHLVARGISDLGDRYITLSALYDSSDTSGVVSAFNKSDHSLIWTRKFSYAHMLTNMVIVEEQDNIGWKRLSRRRFYVATVVKSKTAQTDVLLLRFNDKGDVLWSKLLDSKASEDLRCLKSVNGGAMLSGERQSGNAIDPFFSFIDSNGTVQWSTYIQQVGYQVNANMCYLDNHYYFTGNTTTNGYGADDMCLGKLDNSGKLKWYKVIGSSKGEGSHEINTDGRDLYFGGVQSDAEKGLAILKADTSGKLLWRYLFSGSEDENLHEFNIINDTIYTLGYTNSFGWGMKDLLLTKLDTGGNLITMNAIGGANDEVLVRTEIIRTGSNFLTVWESNSFASNGASLIVEFDANLSNGCSKHTGTLTRTNLTINEKFLTVKGVYDALKATNLSLKSAAFSIDSIKLECGTITSISRPSNQTDKYSLTQTGESIHIENASPFRAELYDMMGRRLYSNKQMSLSHDIDPNVSGSTIILVLLTNDQGISTTQRILVVR